MQSTTTGTSELAAAKAERSSELYGPSRCLAREAAKKKQLEDHMHENFKKGAEIVHSNQTFRTTTGGDFGHKEYQKYHRVKPKHKTYVHFGSDSDPSHSVMQSDFAGPSTSQFQRHIPKHLGRNNLVDFAPQYRVEDTTGTSQYTDDFDGEKHASKVTGREESANFKYHISTHFVLGDDTESPASETSVSFKGDASSDTLVKGASKTKSSLFQEGDYNMTSRNVEGCFISTQKRDFAVGLPAAIVSTVTHTPYSHVTPKEPPECAVGALRKLLIAKNEEEFKNPRDPITVNVVKAFATYDQQKSGSISVEDLKAMCKRFDVPIDNGEIQSLLRECNCEEEGKIDFVKFCEYLTCRRNPPKSESISTNQAAYASRAQNQPDTEESEDDAYRTSTSFVLGYDEKVSDSVYMKDFDSSRLGPANKPPFASGVPCSKVMHEYPVFGSSDSVTTQDYVKHKFHPGRLQSLQEIGERHSAVSVDLSCGPVGDEDLLSSVTALTFTAPKPTDHPEVRIPTVKNYHHLESNRALPHPLTVNTSTEAQQNYKVPLGSEEEYALKKKEGLDDRNTRIQTNKATHFVVGYDPPQNKTEHMSEFFAKKPLEPDVMAAGRPDLPTKGYSITTHDSGEASVATRTKDPQQILQQRNYLKNINPRDTVNLNLRKAFLEYDKNLSGAISKDDLKAACNDMKVDISDADLDDIIARCDLKGDGLIDYHEFALNLSRLQPPGVALLQGTLTSTAQRDFKPPKEQQMDPKQRLATEKDAKRFEPVEVQPSHLFQWDAQTDHLQSIQMRDFKEPQSVLATM